MNNFKKNIYKLYNAPDIPTIACNETASSGGVGVTEFVIYLDKPLGGIVIIDFNAAGIADKLEIIHNGIKKATTGMTVSNYGAFDDLYGYPTVPAPEDVYEIDQFIGTKGNSAIPTRDSAFLTDTGITDVTRTEQQLVWFVYTAANYTAASSVVIRVTGATGTSWSFIRLCTDQDPIGI